MFIVLTVSFSVICFNVAFIRMTNLNDTLGHDENTTFTLAERRFVFSTSQKSLLFSCEFLTNIDVVTVQLKGLQQRSFRL